MKSKYMTEILCALLGMFLVFLAYGLLKKETPPVVVNNTFVDAPFSGDLLLITSAGQSTDAYVFHDIANELQLNNHFMPEADPDNVEKYSAAVIVIGYSEVGMMLNDKSYDEELARLQALAQSFHEANRPVIAAFVGGPDRRSAKTDGLLSALCKTSDFIIVNSHDMDRAFVQSISKNGEIPFSEVSALDQVGMPLAFLFR